MNLLKLPQFNEVDLLKEKLMYAINAQAGFELSWDWRSTANTKFIKFVRLKSMPCRWTVVRNRTKF